MERQVPDVFNVFALGPRSGPPRGGVALPGLSCPSPPQPWELRLREQGSKWAHRRSPCERPRTYDKFYQKSPCNFQPQQGEERDSAISVCSSEECDQVEDKKKRRRPRRSQSERRVRNRTLTERDVKHLERHLSMKRTIRKKIMADLQHAFVRKPDTDGFHIKSLDLEGSLQPNVLDLLRDSDDSGHHSPSRRSQSMREVRKRDSASWERVRGEEREGRPRRGRRSKTPTPDYSKEEVEEKRLRKCNKENKSWWRKLLELLGRKPKS